MGCMGGGALTVGLPNPRILGDERRRAADPLKRALRQRGMPPKRAPRRRRKRTPLRRRAAGFPRVRPSFPTANYYAID